MSLPHIQIAGDIYYITNVIYNRLPIFTRPSFVVPIIDSLNFYRYKQSYKVLGYVIMPDHYSSFRNYELDDEALIEIDKDWG